MIVGAPCTVCGVSLPAWGIALQLLDFVDLVVCARCGTGQRVDNRVSGATTQERVT